MRLLAQTAGRTGTTTDLPAKSWLSFDMWLSLSDVSFANKAEERKVPYQYAATVQSQTTRNVYSVPPLICSASSSLLHLGYGTRTEAADELLGHPSSVRRLTRKRHSLNAVRSSLSGEGYGEGAISYLALIPRYPASYPTEPYPRPSVPVRTGGPMSQPRPDIDPRPIPEIVPPAEPAPPQPIDPRPPHPQELPDTPQPVEVPTPGQPAPTPSPGTDQPPTRA